MLPPNRMSIVLKQIIIEDEWIALQAEKSVSVDVYAQSVHRYRAVFKSAGITEEQFRRSFDYYKAHPQLLRAVFDIIQKQPNLDTVRTAPLRRKPPR